MRKTKEEAEATRQAILQSAMDTFYEKGYSKTTFDEIAKRINLTKGAVYWHFRNKPDLIAAIINDYFEKQKSYIAERQPVIQSFDDIINYFLHHSNFMLSNENNYKVGFFLICQMEWSEAIITKVKPQVAKNKEYWFTPESIDECIKNETIIFLYLCVPSILLLIIQLLRKIFKNEIVQKVLKVVNILIIICSALFFLLWNFLCIGFYFTFQ